MAQRSVSMADRTHTDRNMLLPRVTAPNTARPTFPAPLVRACRPPVPRDPAPTGTSECVAEALPLGCPPQKGPSCCIPFPRTCRGVLRELRTWGGGGGGEGGWRRSCDSRPLGPGSCSVCRSRVHVP